jgi:hypothetical protein
LTRAFELLESLGLIHSNIHSFIHSGSVYSRMAYTDESVRAKLSALNETQESIVTVAQWIMFHRYGACDALALLIDQRLNSFTFRRHADKTAGLWLQRLKDSGAPKRLNLLYLANGMPRLTIPECTIITSAQK